MDNVERKIIYTNSINIGASFHDIAMNIGVNVDNTVIPEILVYMSPQHAKLLIQALESTIQMYEKQFGEIKLPPKTEKATDKEKK